MDKLILIALNRLYFETGIFIIFISFFKFYYFLRINGIKSSLREGRLVLHNRKN